MTVRSMAQDSPFQNPEKCALENLKLSVRNDGVCRMIAALDPYWSDSRTLSYYSPPPKEKNPVLGALQTWQDSMQWFLDDLKWLLCLDFHKFWANIINRPDCMDMLVSFLQEAYPPYLPVHKEKSVMELYNIAYKKVFVIFSRLITNKESSEEWISPDYMGKLIYDKYVFTIPIIWDLCLIYGTTNSNHISKLLEFIFQLQPKYYEDLSIAISFVKEIFEFISLRIENKTTTLPNTFQGLTKQFGGLQSRILNSSEPLHWSALEDYIMHILDTAVTMKIFLELHHPARKIFREKDFHINLINLYENTIPKMYDKVNDLNDVTSDKDAETIYKYLNIIRTELIDVYRFIIYSVVEEIISDINKEENINIYLTIITDSLSEKAFIKDYNVAYPIEADLDILCQAYKDMDPVKCDFILEAVMSNYDDLPRQKPKPKYFNHTQESTSAENGFVDYNFDTVEAPSQSTDIPEEAKIQSSISEVKDILPDLGDGYVLKCLQHYNFDAARVINGILEGNLDESLQKLDSQLPIIPEEKVGNLFKKTGIERLNIYDFDEFDVMNRDDVDMSKIHKGKKKFQHKNLSAMLDDKSYINEMKDKYVKYSVISDDDEYDDTYDDPEHNIVNEASTEAEKRQNLRTVTFRENYECQAESEDETDEESPSVAANPISKDQFCVNPEELRAKQQARRDAKYGPRNNRDVVGRAKGQGQDKEVLLNRQKKAAHKSTTANHNRRKGAQFKQNQGMIH